MELTISELGRKLLVEKKTFIFMTKNGEIGHNKIWCPLKHSIFYKVKNICCNILISQNVFVISAFLLSHPFSTQHEAQLKP